MGKTSTESDSDAAIAICSESELRITVTMARYGNNFLSKNSDFVGEAGEIGNSAGSIADHAAREVTPETRKILL